MMSILNDNFERMFLGTMSRARPALARRTLRSRLGREAILAEHSVQFVAATTVVAQLARGHSEGRLEERLAQFAKPKLLIIDELGYLPFEPNAAHLFLQLVSRRYERGAILLTSNRSIGEWDSNSSCSSPTWRRTRTSRHRSAWRDRHHAISPLRQKWTGIATQSRPSLGGNAHGAHASQLRPLGERLIEITFFCRPPC
ncbi:ATP-binding protein [Bradyrhizobium sp. UFLA06-06]